MADLVTDQGFDPSTSSGSNPWSILQKLPTKRLDRAFANAAEAGIPEQGEQTGGYTSTYVHLSHLPLFPLYTQTQHDLLAEVHERKQAEVKLMDANDPDKLLTGTEKATLSILGHVTGGGSIVSAKRWERRLYGWNAYAKQNLIEQNKLLVFTRWTLPTAQGMPWFVDVLEHRFLNSDSRMKKMGGNVVFLKTGLAPSGEKGASKVTLKLLKTDAKGLKSQKLWTKRLNFDPCEEITFVSDDGRDFSMEIVARIQRPSSTVEAHEMQKRFDKEWIVPMMS